MLNLRQRCFFGVLVLVLSLYISISTPQSHDEVDAKLDGTTENYDSVPLRTFTIEDSNEVIGGSPTPPKALFETPGGDYHVLDYSVRITSNIPTYYKGVLKFVIKIDSKCNSLTFLVKKNLKTPKCALSENMDWDTLKAIQFASDWNAGDKLVLISTGDPNKFFTKGTTYVVQINFLADYSADQQDFYLSQYSLDKDQNQHYYAITAFGNMNKNPLASLYGRSEDDPITAKFSMEEAHKSLTVLGSPVDMLKRITNFSKRDKIPPSMYSFFISKFKPIAKDDQTYTVYVPERNDEDTKKILVRDLGYKIVNGFKQYLQPIPDQIYVNCIVLPKLEPNVMDVWGMIYYQGTQTIDGVQLSELLMLMSDVVKRIEARPSTKISLSAIHETMLLVAKANIEQCLGYEWLHAMVQGRHDELWAHLGLLEFLKYREVSKYHEHYNSMDIMYVDHLQPFLWKNVFGLGQISTSEEEEIYFSRMRYISFWRMLHDFLVFNTITSQRQLIASYVTFDGFLSSVLQNFGTEIISQEGLIENMRVAMHTTFGRENSFDLHDWMTSYDEYPVVYIHFYANGTLHIEQKHQHGETLIPIPIVIQSRRKLPRVDDRDVHVEVTPTFNHVVIHDQAMRGFQHDKLIWILANPEISVPYRVNYATSLWEALVKRLTELLFHNVHELNRAQLIDDSLTLFYQQREHLTSPVIPFKILSYLKEESYLLPWNVASRHFKFLYQKTSHLPVNVTYKKFVSDLVRPLYVHHGIDGKSKEKLPVKKLRSIAIDLACMFDIDECKNDVKDLISMKTNPYLDLNSDTRDAVCCAAVRLGHQEFMEFVLSHVATNSDMLKWEKIQWENFEWDELEIKLSQTSDPDELNFYLRCITCITEPKFLPNYAKLFFEVEKTNNALQLQEYFKENVAFSAYPLMLAYSSLRDKNYTMGERSLIRWFAIAANQVTNEIESRTIDQTLSDFLSRATHDQYLAQIKSPEYLFTEAIRQKLNKIAENTLSLLDILRRELEDAISNQKQEPSSIG